MLRDRLFLSRFDERKIHEKNLAARVMKRRFLYSLAVSETAALVGAPLTGIVSQYTTGNPYNGIAGTIVGDFISASAAFSVTWYGLNRHHYSASKSKAKQFMRDYLPFFGIDLAAAIPAYAASAALSYGYVKAAEHYSQDFARLFPSSLVSETVNYLLIEAIYLYGVLKLVDRPLANASGRYAEYLNKKFN